MKVRCIKLLDESTGDPLETSSWLSLESVYHVLSVNMEDGAAVKFQLMSDNGTPAFHNANQFEIVSDIIPARWVINFVAGSHVELSPKLWSEPGFWESYFDGEPEAISLFDTEKEIIFQE
ncbi:hypothetical protein CWC22_020655 [Pseudoalteromonas rubra]|uniref:Uncharacterized protein n=1 Tax=Pseudoalteromonas rubra TaxID=43658 RepID=A0A5S3UPD8_9GAMM|nr:hypothetical protein [Pseudoalteromonas rubra]QPB85433.1 hypothetical protein CWC22_020655 [Pseudoalteromonas rubra]